ncbi:MAG: phosphate ABC transporter permease subunit PstC [Thermoanaerobacteraceae bacterium]|nr:phosphate ABC transporter permease subunit PstC [Thermoanaerobacteraceae bacterium]
MKGVGSKKINELFGKTITTICGISVIIIVIMLVVFITYKGLSTFIINKVSVLEFLTSSSWNPELPSSEGGPKVGAFVFIYGSLLISSLALLFSAPMSAGTAIFISEIAPQWGQKVLQPVIELFVGIPSVVYGWVGLSVLVPFIRDSFGGFGMSVLAGSIVLSIMMFPTITSVMVDSLKALPSDLNEASYALGATRWQTIWKVLLPAAMPGMFTGVILGLARGLGEALAVQMVIGNMPGKIPTSLLDPAHTMTSIITMDMGNTVMGTLANNALWSIALLLLLISLIFILLIRLIGKRRIYR